MWIIVGCYVLIFLAVTACIFAAIRNERVSGQADEGPGPEPFTVIPEEWDVLRREHCGPTSCPRAVGDPAGPRKDAGCRRCAAEYLEHRWALLLGESSSGSSLARTPRRRGNDRR
jgi:hypothetical protein